MMHEANPCFLGETYRGQNFVWGHRSLTTLVSNSNFVDCEIILNCRASGLCIGNSVFEGCRVRAKRPQRNDQFFSCDFKGCSFFGDFGGCEFGARLKFGRKDRLGTIADCDFREAIIDLVTFNNCNFATLKVPLWPHATFVNPQVAGAALPADSPYESVSVLRRLLTSAQPVTMAMSIHVPSYLKRDKSLSEAEFQGILSPVPGIVM